MTNNHLKNQNLRYSSLFLLITYISFSLFQETNAINKKPSNSQAIRISEIQYFIYYIPEKEIVLCSDKIFKESEINLIPNELKLDDKFTCMINLDQTKIYYRINLHILKTKSKDYKKNLIDIYLGETPALENINILRVYGENNDQSYLRKQILVKFFDSKVYFLNNMFDCKIDDLDNCDFMGTEEALFRKNNLMLNIKLKEPEVHEISLLEKISLNKESDQCEPSCINGVCVDGDCYCLNGYMGLNCGTELKVTEFRIGLPLLILLFIIAFLLGMLIMHWLIKLFLYAFNSDERKEVSDEIDILEKWTIPDKN